MSFAPSVADFIASYEKFSANERANFPGFAYELCDLLGVPRPQQAGDDDALNAYVFERSVDFTDPEGKKSKGRIDLYKRGCFVLEAKQDANKVTADTLEQQTAILALAEELDTRRKTDLAADPKITLTGLYNALEAARAGRPLSAKEKRDYAAGHSAIIRDLHDRLAAAAYGLPANAPDATILDALVALNTTRLAEEASGRIRFLRQDLQKK